MRKWIFWAVSVVPVATMAFVAFVVLIACHFLRARRLGWWLLKQVERFRIWYETQIPGGPS